MPTERQLTQRKKDSAMLDHMLKLILTTAVTCYSHMEIMRLFDQLAQLISMDSNTVMRQFFANHPDYRPRYYGESVTTQLPKGRKAKRKPANRS